MNGDEPHGHSSHAAGGRLCLPESARKVVSRRLAIAKGHLESILKARLGSVHLIWIKSGHRAAA